MSLNTCLLVSLTIYSFGNNRTNRPLLNKVMDQLALPQSDDRYIQRLLPPSELSAINSAIRALRKCVHDFTLPWLDDARIILNARVFDFMTAYRTCLNTYETALDELVSRYPALVDAAREQQKEWFNAALYPDQEEFRAAFKVQFTLFPLPNLDTDFRVDMPAAIIEDAKSAYKTQLSTIRTNWINYMATINTKKMTDSTRERVVERLTAIREDAAVLFPNDDELADKISFNRHYALN